MNLLEDALCYQSSTIDEYSLSHYFAYLLTDDYCKLYTQAASDGKLKVYRDGSILTTTPGEIEPTCISDQPDEFHPSLYRLKGLVEKQLARPQFWITDEDWLLAAGTCIGEMMVEKIKIMAGG